MRIYPGGRCRTILQRDPLFAFRSPLSKGAILADEVGLGKTIEAGMVMAQRWAERNRRILVIAPANLRKQWSQELADKFYLPSVILETGSFNDALRQKNLNPFAQAAVVICSCQFAYAKAAYLENIDWHLGSLPHRGIANIRTKCWPSPYFTN